MNFFGHAVVAGWTDNRAGHLLGSMLPDFATMVRVPLVAVRDPDMRRGIDLHHRTDDAFHRTPSFLALCAYALNELTAAGVRRGTALEVEVNGRLQRQDDGQAFTKLHGRLMVWGAPRDYAETPFVLARLTDALQRRPALALLEEQSARVGAFLPFLQQMVERTAPELLNGLQDALGLGD